jgi:hypothetical protein
LLLDRDARSIDRQFKGTFEKGFGNGDGTCASGSGRPGSGIGEFPVVSVEAQIVNI